MKQTFQGLQWSATGKQKRDAALPCWKKWLLLGPYSETSKQVTQCKC